MQSVFCCLQHRELLLLLLPEHHPEHAGTSASDRSSRCQSVTAVVFNEARLHTHSQSEWQADNTVHAHSVCRDIHQLALLLMPFLTALCAAKDSAFTCSCTCCSSLSSAASALRRMLRWILPASRTEAAAITPATVGLWPVVCGYRWCRTADRVLGQHEPDFVRTLAKREANTISGCLMGDGATAYW